MPAEEKNRKWNIANVKRELKQAVQGCTHIDHTDQHAIMKFPGEKEVKFWKTTKENMEGNYSRPQTTAHSEIS